MKTHRIGIIMNGVTGRMGTNQHLLRSIKAIIDQGGIKLGDTEVIMPGAREFRMRERRIREGIPLDEKIWRVIEECARNVGVRLE